MPDYDPLDWRTISAYATTHKGHTPEQIAAVLVRGLSKADLVRFARAYVAEYVESLRRASARRTETGAASPSARNRALAAEFAQLYDDPTRYPGNAKDRAAFRSWCGDRFDEWYDRGLRAAQDGGARPLHMFEDDWHPDGVYAAARMALVSRVAETVEQVASQIRLETTRELLESVFALGDGTEVTWGQATVPQHEQRIAMLEKSAVGTLETAARHTAAITMIKDSNGACLNDLSSAA